MSKKNLQREEYEAQYYKHFTSSTFVEAFKTDAKEIVQDQFKQLLETTVTNVKNDIEKEAMEKDFKNMLSNYEDAMNEPFSKLQTASSNFFEIPNNVLLSEDDHHQLFSENGGFKIDELKKEVAELETKYLQQKNYITRLQEELANNANVLSLKEHIDPFIQCLKQKNQKAVDTELDTLTEMHNKYSNMCFEEEPHGDKSKFQAKERD